MSLSERRGSRDNDRVAELPVVDTGGAQSPSERSLNWAGAGPGGGGDRQANGHDGGTGAVDPVEIEGSDRERGGSGESSFL